ncbi:putative reverse transcriptase [Hordeum vulgare]|nr:putative reverse transcriptase [Hordeum vulgare]
MSSSADRSRLVKTRHLCTASSAVLLNGTTGCYFTHQRGLRQGDSLSPLLFIITIDTLHRLLEKATELQEIAPLPGRGIPLRVSLYVDDAVIFANPAAEEITVLMAILRDFGRASGLLINPSKSTAAPIRCDGADLHHILAAFGGKVVAFPLTYLGLPITLSRLRLVHVSLVFTATKRPSFDIINIKKKPVVAVAVAVFTGRR